MRDKKKIIEAALFIAARPMTLAELYHVVGVPKPQIKSLLEEMEKEYDEHSLSVRERDGYYELHIKEEYKDHVEHLAPEKDFSKATLQTLSLIAYHNPAKQSFVVETRGNRAYDHIKELTSRGFVRLEPEGHTNRIHITKKFLDYFGLTSPKDLKEYFSDRGVEPPDEDAWEENVAKDEPSSAPEPPTSQKSNLPRSITAPQIETPATPKKQEEQDKQKDSEMPKDKEPEETSEEPEEQERQKEKKSQEIPKEKRDMKQEHEKQETGQALPTQPEEEHSEPKKEEKQKKQAKKSVNIKDEPYKSPFADVMKDDVE